MTAEDLHAFWNETRRANAKQRIALFGHNGRGTITALKALANYASNKATAMQCRERGTIETAQMYETICERIYATLPAFARW